MRVWRQLVCQFDPAQPRIAEESQQQLAQELADAAAAEDTEFDGENAVMSSS